MKTAARKVMWVGRATVFLVGVAIILALAVGLASTALAGTGVGARLDLGRTNAVNAVTTLVGSVAGPSLKIDNNSTGTGATALRLEVEPGKPPLSVNSTTEVQGLNVDSLDSKNSSDFLQESTDRDDFLPNDTYVISSGSAGFGGGTPAFRSAACDEGDKVLGGGGSGDIFRDDLLFSAPDAGGAFGGRDRWSIVVRDNADATFVDAKALCADFPPLR